MRVRAGMLLAAMLVGIAAVLTAPAAAQTVINVADGPSLSAAIAQVDSNASASYVINFQNNITLTSAASNTLNAFNTTSNVTVAGNGFALNGGGVQRGFFVYSGTVAISNIRKRWGVPEAPLPVPLALVPAAADWELVAPCSWPAAAM